MRHRRRVKAFSRKYNARKALIRGLVESLVEHGRITTTVDKAKEIRRHVEKAITLGKKGTLEARRLMVSKFPSANTAEVLFKDLAPRFAKRNGGYTRIIKIGRRPGDTAEMAFLEFVDYDFTSKVAPEKSEDTKKEKTKAKVKTVTKKSVKSLVAKKKSVKKIQRKARQASRV